MSNGCSAEVLESAERALRVDGGELFEREPKSVIYCNRKTWIFSNYGANNRLHSAVNGVWADYSRSCALSSAEWGDNASRAARKSPQSEDLKPWKVRKARERLTSWTWSYSTPSDELALVLTVHIGSECAPFLSRPSFGRKVKLNTWPNALSDTLCSLMLLKSIGCDFGASPSSVSITSRMFSSNLCTISSLSPATSHLATSSYVELFVLFNCSLLALLLTECLFDINCGLSGVNWFFKSLKYALLLKSFFTWCGFTDFEDDRDGTVSCDWILWFMLRFDKLWWAVPWCFRRIISYCGTDSWLSTWNIDCSSLDDMRLWIWKDKNVIEKEKYPLIKLLKLLLSKGQYEEGNFLVRYLANLFNRRRDPKYHKNNCRQTDNEMRESKQNNNEFSVPRINRRLRSVPFLFWARFCVIQCP